MRIKKYHGALHVKHIPVGTTARKPAASLPHWKHYFHISFVIVSILLYYTIDFPAGKIKKINTSIHFF